MRTFLLLLLLSGAAGAEPSFKALAPLRVKAAAHFLANKALVCAYYADQEGRFITTQLRSPDTKWTPDCPKFIIKADGNVTK